MVWRDFCCLFSCLGVLFVFVLFFWAKKKKPCFLVFVLLLVRTLRY